MSTDNTKQFIEDAIAGGYTDDKKHTNFIRTLPQYALCQVFLDPSFWQAVGKTRGWGETVKYDGMYVPEWLYNMHRLITYLADGKTIDEALAAISE